MTCCSASERRWRTCFVQLLLGFSAIALNVAPSHSATFMVVTTDDSGPGSLRNAITQANSLPGRDVIAFAISDNGPHVIRPLTELPAITESVEIDGYSQPGSQLNQLMTGNDAIVQIELEGQSIIGNGLRVQASHCAIRGLALYNFTQAGVRLALAHTNVVTGNFLGTDASGLNLLGNEVSGITLEASHGNRIGGPSPGERNLIVGNRTDGVRVVSGSGNQILGNYIGVARHGLSALGNTRGVTLLEFADGNVIGGRAPGSANLISGNTLAGLNILSSSNRIEGNVVGPNASGATLGNGTDGIVIAGSANSVGGLDPDAANSIAGNGNRGIVITDDLAIENSLLGNRIYQNSGLAIDLDDDETLEPNDADDADEGANRLQNHPMLLEACGGPSSWVQGTLTSRPNKFFRIELFLSDESGDDSQGEAQVFLGSTNVLTSSEGTVSFTWSSPGAFPSHKFVSATATDSAGNTSELSPAFETSLCVTNASIRINGVVAGANVLVTNEAWVEILSPFAGGRVLYTLDGSTPSQGATYGGPFQVAESCILRALALGDDSQEIQETLSVALTVVHPPRITRQPGNARVPSADSATFEVLAAGSLPLSFQWVHNGSDLAGASSSVLTLTNVQAGQAGTYLVRVSNSIGSTTSAPAQLTVETRPVIGSHPATQTSTLGGNVSFCVTVAGTEPLLFQWRRNGVNLPGATNACLTITNVALADGGAYSVVVVNAAGAAASEPAFLQVDVPVVVPGDTFAERVPLNGLTNTIRGTNEAFSLEPEEPEHAGKPGGRSAWYSWRAATNGVVRFRTVGSGFDTLLAVYTGTSMNTLEEVASDEDTGGFLTSEVHFGALAGTDYAVAVDAFAGLGGEFTLDWRMEITEDVLPVVRSGPGSVNVPRGSDVTLTVDALGAGLTYQWHFNRVPLLAATAPTLVLSNVQPAHVGFYSVVIRNAAGREIVTRPAAVELGDSPGPVSEDKFEDARPRSAAGLLQAAGISSSPPHYVVFAGDIRSHYLSNVEGTTSPDETNHCGVVNNSTRWLFLYATNSGTMVVDTVGSTIPTVLAVYIMGLVGRSTLPVACGVAPSTAPVESVRATFSATAGKTYAIVVDGLDGATGGIRLGWALGQPPTVPVNALTNLVVTSGANATLRGPQITTVPAAEYQWLRNGVSIAGATNSELNLFDIQEVDEGHYSLSIQNAIGGTNIPIGTVYLELPLLTLTALPFDTSVQSWSLDLSRRALAFSTSGGNPAGCMVVSAGATNETWYWVAPPSVLGDLSPSYGGWLQFDLQESLLATPSNSPPLVRIVGRDATLSFWETPAAENSGLWQRHRVPLVETGPGELGVWRFDGPVSIAPTQHWFLHTLSNVVALKIRGRAGSFLSSRLDNVALLDARTVKIGWNAEGGLLLTWAEGFVPFQLEGTDRLGANAIWATNLPIVRHTTDKGLHQVDLLPSGNARFFRLSKPE